MLSTLGNARRLVSECSLRHLPLFSIKPDHCFVCCPAVKNISETLLCHTTDGRIWDLLVIALVLGNKMHLQRTTLA